MKKIILLGAALAALLGAPAAAQRADAGAAEPASRQFLDTRVRERFERIDTNRDGMISREEFEQRRLRKERGERRDVPGGFGARIF